MRQRIAHRKTDQWLGYFAFHNMATAHKAPVFISYALLPEHQRQGFAKEALSLLLEQVREKGVLTLEARTHFDNSASAKLLTAVGFLEAAATSDRRRFVWPQQTTHSPEI